MFTHALRQIKPNNAYFPRLTEASGTKFAEVFEDLIFFLVFF